MSGINKSGTLTSPIGLGTITFPVSYPYTILPTDYAIIVDASSSRTINLPASVSSGTRYFIKDGTGQSNSNPITVNGNGHTIDGMADYVISFTYGFVSVLFNGSQWNVSNN